jgi:hypothetical protein
MPIWEQQQPNSGFKEMTGWNCRRSRFTTVSSIASAKHTKVEHLAAKPDKSNIYYPSSKTDAKICDSFGFTHSEMNAPSAVHEQAAGMTPIDS